MVVADESSHKNVASSADSLTCFLFLSHFCVDARRAAPSRIGSKVTANVEMVTTAAVALS